MGLSCECDYDGDGWFYIDHHETTLRTKRSRRCCSCRTLIKPGSVVVEFPRIKTDELGDEVCLAPYFMCEPCGDLFWTLESLGFCMTIGDESMQSKVREYNEIYQPPRRST